ncbi:MAG: hypothetical protein N2C14_25200 [Planctomycetales bacterium]
MLDRKFLVENLEAVQENCRNRGADVDFERIIALEADRKAKTPDLDELRRKANDASKQIPKEKDPDKKKQLIEEGRALRGQVGELEKELAAINEELNGAVRLVPNMSHPDAPIGKDDKANLEISKGKTPIPEFDFKPQDHVEIGERLDLIDLEAGARVAGHGFYFLRGDAVLLELALQQYAVTELIKEGFTPTITPDVAYTSIVDGVGFIPRGPETQIYNLEGRDLSLIATA